MPSNTSKSTKIILVKKHRESLLNLLEEPNHWLNVYFIKGYGVGAESCIISIMKDNEDLLLY